MQYMYIPICGNKWSNASTTLFDHKKRLLKLINNSSSLKKDSVWSNFHKLQSSSKILHCVVFFQLSSWCLEMWLNTVFPVWYITSRTTNLNGKKPPTTILTKVLRYLKNKTKQNKLYLRKIIHTILCFLSQT